MDFFFSGVQLHFTTGQNISLQKYADTANQKFSETENRLTQIAGSFETRMNGKSKAGIIGSMFGTICWAVAVCVFFGYIGGYVDSTLHLVCLGIALALLGTLLIDEIISFSYYGKISSYRDNINQLKNRVSVGRSSIKSNQDAFMKSRSNGWRHPLPVGTSIPEEATSIEGTINGMESLKGGFINGLKNFLYFSFVIAITGVGSWAFFGTAGEIITGISGESMESDTMMTLYIIGLLIVEVGIVIMAKMWWSHTDCSVTNTTLWIAPLGPVLFLLLAAVATLLVMLVIWAVSIVIAIAGAALAIGIACASISGG